MNFIEPIIIKDGQLWSTNVANDVDENGDPIVKWEIDQSISADDVRLFEDIDQHWIVRALVSHTSSALNKPTGLKEDTNWVYLYDSNPWRMYDNSGSSQSSQADLIDSTVAVTEAVNSAALINVFGNTAQITMEDQNGQVVYSNEVSLLRWDNVYDYETYFFAPVEYQKDVIFNDLPIYYLSKINVKVHNAGGIARCGSFIVGNYQSAGFTEYGMKRGIRDFSVKTADEFGNYTITPRKFSKKITLTTNVEKTKFDTLAYKFEELRATGVLYIGSSEYESSAVFGFYTDFYIVAAYPNYSVVNFEIEGIA